VESSQATAEKSVSSAMGRVMRGAGSNALAQAISACTALLLVPLFLHAWGTAQYGRWLTLTSMVTYLLFLDFGGQSFIGNLLASDHARGNQAEFRRHFSEGFSLFGYMGLLGFFILVGVVTLMPAQVFHQSWSLGREDRIVLFCMGTTVLLAVPGGIISTAYRAAGFFAQGAMIGNVSRGLTLLISIAILIGGVGPGLYASTWLASSLLLFFYMVLDIYRRIPALQGSQFTLLAARTGLAHLPDSLFFWLWSISMALNLQGVVLVLAMTGTAAGVALFVTHRTICGLVGYIGGFVQSPLMPELNYLHSRGQQELLRRASLLVMKTVTLATTFASLGLWLLLPIVYPRWTGRNLVFDPVLLAILLSQAVLAVGWQSSAWTLQASNQHRRLSCWAFGNGVVTVGLAIVMAPRWGVHGVALASLCGDLICGLAVYPTIASKALGLSKALLFKTILVPLIAMGPLWGGALLAHLGRSISFGQSWLLALMSVLLIFLGAWWSFRKKEDTEWIMVKLRAFARR